MTALGSAPFVNALGRLSCSDAALGAFLCWNSGHTRRTHFGMEADMETGQCAASEIIEKLRRASNLRTNSGLGLASCALLEDPSAKSLDPDL